MAGKYDIFFHPDYTVGIGVSPIRLPKQVADCTASGEFHPALKIFLLRYSYYSAYGAFVKGKFYAMT